MNDLTALQIKDELMLIRRWLCTISFVVALGSLGLVLALIGLRPQAVDTVATEWQQLLEEYTQCMDISNRTSACVLEYDGDGSSTTPADYHWYWLKEGEQQW